MQKIITAIGVLAMFAASCASNKSNTGPVNYSDSLPAPFATKSSMNFSNVVGWEDGKTPIAPPGFTVKLYADGFYNPRWMYVTPNGDVLVAEANTEVGFIKKIGAAIVGATKADNLGKSANRITLLRDADKDGVPELKQAFLENLNKPFGMLVLGKWLYVANTDALIRFPYEPGQTSISAAAEKIADIPGEGRHWTRHIITSKDGTKIYIAVGSASNVAEDGMDKELNRACILEINPDGSGMRVYASGLRNPVGMAWEPSTGALWTTVNERDELGDDLVPDYLTHVQENGFYGWPYSYFGQHPDPRMADKQQPALVAKAIVPDVPLGAHTASLGLAFGDKSRFPKKYRSGAFIAQHGSWNRSVLSGYKVVFVPFRKGQPSGKPQDFLTGFVKDLEQDKVHGRPTGIVFLPDGSMLLTDDTSNRIWRISYR
jgi:glucose/arabinose dehydrogenase